MVKEELVSLLKDNEEEVKRRCLEEFGESDSSSSVILNTGGGSAIELDTFYNHLLDYIFNSRKNISDVQEWVNKITEYDWPLRELTDALHIFRRKVILVLGERIDEKAQLIALYGWLEELTNPIQESFVDMSTSSWENTVSIQKSALMELSAPLIPVMEHISVMPLIGTIDSERAKLVMENLLDGVIKHRSEVVLIDITGVPVVDTMVAHHIIQASEAVRLIGAKCILVGIRPEIAQTIVNLGIDLSAFPTRSTLRKGIETALELTKRQIISVEEESEVMDIGVEKEG